MPPTPGVPVAALQQFLAALRSKDFQGAKALAFQSALALAAVLERTGTSPQRAVGESPRKRETQRAHECHPLSATRHMD